MTRFVISPEQSQMWIEARSNVHPIHASTYGVGGHLDVVVGSDGRVDVAANPSGELSLAVDRLRSGNRLEDRELHRRIDSGRFPNIVGVLKTMEASGVHGTYKVGGDITFRGVSREREGLMDITRLDEHSLRLEGKSRFDIRDFGMDPPRLLMARVEPEVEIRIQIVAVEVSEERTVGRTR
jgi:hypothetical protein